MRCAKATVRGVLKKGGYMTVREIFEAVESTGLERFEVEEALYFSDDVEYFEKQFPGRDSEDEYLDGDLVRLAPRKAS